VIARVFLCFALLAGSAQLASASAASAAQILSEADRLYDNLDYRGAAELAQSVIQAANGTTKEQARAWERIGLCWLVLGQNKLAQEAFDSLFTLEPTRKVIEPSLSPRQRDFIEHARAKHPAPPPVEEPPVVESPETPPAIVVAAPPAKRPLVKRWYLWTPIAVGVVGVAVGVGLGLGLPRPSPKGTLPTVGLSLHF
jgi:tetratricopeptide (TPR) repeat protein